MSRLGPFVSLNIVQPTQERNKRVSERIRPEPRFLRDVDAYAKFSILGKGERQTFIFPGLLQYFSVPEIL